MKFHLSTVRSSQKQHNNFSETCRVTQQLLPGTRQLSLKHPCHSAIRIKIPNSEWVTSAWNRVKSSVRKRWIYHGRSRECWCRVERLVALDAVPPSTYRRKIFAKSRSSSRCRGYIWQKYPPRTSFALGESSLTCITSAAAVATVATGTAPCNLAAENRVNRKVKMKLGTSQGKWSNVSPTHIYVLHTGEVDVGRG